ncbi:uncharacterized protein LOC133139304 [Conger conger]|uniref:uncharacterized protein LOC133139304 n=1 Tax=Conger conger TaxID=82655 RepID=UPI002A5AA8F9|nr:uncharacterized protein LOC133139304 [Conger conger]
MDNKLLVNVPQLSNAMQLSIMHRVKTGELTIEDALNQARRETGKQQRVEEENIRHNFSVYKHNRYRWQKRILQIDFNTKLVCSIEKGIIKRQLPFSSVKSCEDGAGAKFSVSFWGRHDYELEATSLEDKQKIMQLVHQIIHGNIYEVPVHTSPEVCEAPAVTQSLREGQLYLQRGGLASFRWVKYLAQLHHAEMTLVPCSGRGTGDCDGFDLFSLPRLLPIVIHFSDGDASVETPRTCDTFTLLTKKNEYQFRVPVMDQAKSTDAIGKERDEWVRAVDRLCLEWKRRSQVESRSVYEMGKSAWARCSSKVRIDTVRLYEQFAIEETGCLASLESTNSVNIMLNDKIAHNFNIFLKSFPVAPGELKDKLYMVYEEDGGLTDEHITSLRRYVPTPDDVEMYKSHKGPLSELHVVDQYMMEMCRIPFLSARLDLLLTLRELPISMEDLQPLINQMIRMCNQLSGCRAFFSVLEYLLAVGNYLNENAGKEKARGVRLSSLTKLSQLRGKGRKFTLLHALVEQIVLHEPHLATFSQELTEFETVPGASIKGLVAEVDVLKNELQKVVQHKKTQKVKNQGPQHQKFLRDLKTAIERYSADLSQLTKKCEEMKKLYADILVKYGEPSGQDSQELFGWVCTFTADFKRVHAEMTL